ncbi:unnamed protein product [Mytilus coruscus]|uniref:Uncharacterized protein n=1 Tax=Mytilus coruscus TaxID=42192 RepID=A0A6J8DUQ7_MYTCO|nr:unnamed protein product [Mytilus coruscus]
MPPNQREAGERGWLMLQFKNSNTHRGLDSRSCRRANPRRNPRRGPVMVCRVLTKKTRSLLRRPVRVSDRDKFIRRIFGFLKPHIRRHKKDTPASFKDKLALAETGELAGSDDSTMAAILADEPKEPTKKFTGYPTPKPPSRTRKAADDRPESPTMEIRVTVTVVIQFRMRKADGDQISSLEYVSSAFKLQQSQQQRAVAVIQVAHLPPTQESANFYRRVPFPAVSTTPPAELSPPSQQSSSQVQDSGLLTHL